MSTAILSDRGLVKVSGETARDFLQGLFTCDMKSVGADDPAFGGLLTPQGKILFDFLVFELDNRFFLDCRRDQADELTKRLTFYKLRAAVEIENVSENHDVIAGWGDGEVTDGAQPDPRFGKLGWRMIAPAGEYSTNSDVENWHAHRIALGIPEGGLDYDFGDAFPHEADMDLLNGISFSKGCYVGQEVVSRMEHRGTARTRTIAVSLVGDVPAPGTEIRAGEKIVGTLGSAANGRAVALVRTDRVKSALGEGLSLTAGETLITHVAIDWADFGLSGDA